MPFANLGLEIRGNVDAAYERIIQTMFECLQQIAKMEIAESKESEDKGQLYYHFILIGESFGLDCICLELTISQRTCTILSQRSHSMN